MSVEGQLASLEGRLLGHRKLLAQLLANSPAPTRAAIADWLAQQETLMDGQEDPGAVPQTALALELALSDELHRIAELARAIGHRSAGG